MHVFTADEPPTTRPRGKAIVSALQKRCAVAR